MKWIEDLLKAKLGNSKADATPSLDEALWNNIQTGLNEPAFDSGSAGGNSTRLNRAALASALLFIVVGVVGVVGVVEGLKGGMDGGLEADSAANTDEALSAQVEQSETVVQEVNRTKQVPLETEQVEDWEALSELTAEAPVLSERTSDPMASSPAPIQPGPKPAFRGSNRPEAARAGVDDEQGGASRGMKVEKSEVAAVEAVVENRMTPPMKPMNLRLPIRNWPTQAAMITRGTGTGEPYRPRYLAVRAFGGLTLSDFQYTSDDLGTFSEYFYGGSSAGGGIAVDFNFKNQQWSVGLGWLDYAQRLEFEHTWQTEFVDPEGLISYEMDPESGDTLAMETGPLLVTASHRRHFRNYNHVNALVIPFEWRKEWLIARWTLGGGIGGQLLLRTGANGHSFADEGNLAAFEDADLPQSRVTWSPFTRLFAGYQIQPEWRLDASVAAGFQAMGSVGSEQLNSPGLQQWEGQLRTLQVAAGITRFFELSRPKSAQ